MTSMLPPTTLLDREIRAAVHDLAAGRRSLEDFEGWFVGATWNVATADPDGARLVFAIELRLAEYGLGHLSDDEFAAELQSLADTFTWPSRIVTSTATRRIDLPLALA